MLLSDSVQYLKGIGEKRAELFHKLGIFSPWRICYITCREDLKTGQI